MSPSSKSDSSKENVLARSANRSRSLSSSCSNDTQKDSSTIKLEDGLPIEIDAVVDISFTAIQAAADIASVPGLSGVASLVQSIAKLCLNVKRNKCVCGRLPRGIDLPSI